MTLPKVVDFSVLRRLRAAPSAYHGAPRLSRPRIRFLVVCVLVLAAGMLIEIFLLPHYVAPLHRGLLCHWLAGHAPPSGLEAGRQARRASRWSGSPFRFASLLAGLRLFAAPLHIASQEWPASSWNFDVVRPAAIRHRAAQIEAALSSLPGSNLADRALLGQSRSLDEWVYNAADIDDSKVVWARDMDAADNLQLITITGTARSGWLSPMHSRRRYPRTPCRPELTPDSR